jgi:hypothetical protein
LLHWQTTLVVQDVEVLTQQLRRHQVRLVSPRVVTIPGQALGFRKGLLVRDPDGHVLRLVEKFQPLK